MKLSRTKFQTRNKHIFLIFIITLGFSLLNPSVIYCQKDANFTRDSVLGIHYYEKADDLYENIDSCLYYSHRAIPLLKKTKQWDKYVYTLCGLSYCYNSLEQYDSMEINNLLAYKEAQKFLPDSSQTYINALNNYALVESEIRENYITALELYKKAHKISRAKYTVNYGGKGSVETNIGQMHFFLGDFDTALEFYREAKKSYEQVTHKDTLRIPHFQIAKVLDKMAKVYFSMGEFYEAKKIQEKSIDALEKEKEKEIDENFKIRIHTEYIKIIIALKDYDKASSLLGSLRLNPRLTPLQKAKIYHLKGIVYFKKENFSRALDNLKRALNQNITENKIKEKVEIHRSISDVHNARSRFKDALFHQQEAIKLILPKCGFNYDCDTLSTIDGVQSKFELYNILIKKGITLNGLLKEEKSKKYLNKIRNTYRLLSLLKDDIRSFYRSVDSKLLLQASAKDFYEDAINIAYTIYLQEKDPKVLEEAFFYLEKSKSNLLIDQLRKNKLLNKDLFAREYEIKYEINNLEKKIIQEKSKLKKGNIDSDIDNLETLVHHKKNILNNFRNSIKRSYPNYATIIKENPVILDSIQSKLDSNNVILEYFVGRNHIFIFKITPEEVDIHRIENNFNLDQLIDRLLNNLEMHIDTDIRSYQEAAFNLHEKLIRPVNLLPDTNVIVIPDGRLENLPFDLLVSEIKNPNQPQKFSYLLHDFSFSYSYSSTILIDQIRKVSQETSNILAIFPEFKDVKKEVTYSKEFYNYLKKFSCSILKNANKKTVLEKLNNHNIVHFYTHARSFDQDHKEPTIDLYNDTLSLTELENNLLEVDLVILSACETNVGKYEKGEGMMSLTRGFTYTGVPSVITSISKVDDESTSKIIKSFYENISKGMKKDKALQQAKITYLKNAPEDKSSPYHWGVEYS